MARKSKQPKNVSANNSMKTSGNGAVKPAANVLADASAKKDVKEPLKTDVVKTETVKPISEAAEKKDAAPIVEKKRPGRPKGSTNKKPSQKTNAGRNAKKDTADAKVEVFVQLDGMEYSQKNIMNKVVAAWEAEGKKASALKRVKLYVKPEEGKAYYVANEKLKNASTGAVDL